MTFNVRDNLELVHAVASGLPDRDYDPHVDERTERDELDAYYDEHEDCFAMSLWDPNLGWIDA